MAGLFDTLSLGSRSLATYRKAIDTSGHNLANVNTPGYTRQRLVIQSVSNSTEIGQVGAGAEAVRVERLQNDFFDQQVQVESSVQGSLNSRQSALQQALNALQENVDRSGSNGTTTSGISQDLADFFASAQSISTNPTSLAERQVFLEKAQALAGKFNQVDTGLASVASNVNQQISGNVAQVNSLVNDIAKLNASIVQEEATTDGAANDLRDSRQQKIEELAGLVKIDTAAQPSGAVNVMVSGVTLVDGSNVANTLETFDANGATQVRVAGQTDALALTGGSIEGSITARDNDVGDLRAQVNSLAQTFITEVNKVHSAGFSLTGSTGANLFNGTSAADIAVNPDLVSNPSLIQASAVSGDNGNNQAIIGVAQLATAAQSALGGQSFSDRQAQMVAGVGQKAASAQKDLDDQNSIVDFVKGQRESVSGVSLDEEMSNLVMFQKAFQASAKLISMTDEMLSTIIQM